MIQTTQYNEAYSKTLFQALVESAKKYGKKTLVLQDPTMVKLDYNKIIIGALALGKKITRFTHPGEAVGILLPNVNGAVVTLFAVSAYGRTPAMLNFSAGEATILSACQTAQVKTVLSSRKFIEMGEFQPLVDGLEAQGITFHWLEDIKDSIGLGNKIAGLLKSKVTKAFLYKYQQNPENRGVILFTSGTEGAPKAVVLSHRNIVANIDQIFHATDWRRDDIIFNPLPIFHSFGLTAGMLNPLFNGMFCFLYPSPLHYKQIPGLIRKTKATVLFGTDTFLFGYARQAREHDLDTLRFVIGGAEKLKDRTRAFWQEKFGKELYEGYGATETAPVVSVNVPGRNKPGSVGPILRDIDYKLEPVAGLTEGGELHVKGPNIMMGYMFADNPGVLVRPDSEWYNLGDIASVDEEGFITLQGRTKRFAKIGGEMVSLAAVENFVSSLWPDNAHVVCAVEDERKGEQLVLVTDLPGIERKALVEAAKAQGFSELGLPRKIVTVEEVPLLGTGKTDYNAVTALAVDGA